MSDRKELSLDELDNITGGVDVATDLYAKYKGGRVEVYYDCGAYDRSYGGVIIDVARGSNHQNGRIAINIQFDSPGRDGWFWLDQTGPGHVYLNWNSIKGKTWDELQATDVKVM